MDQALLYKLFKGEASRSEKQAVKDWVMASEQNEHLFFQQRKLFDLLALMPETEEKRGGKNRWGKELMRIAAAVIITLVCSSIGFYIYNNKVEKPAPMLVQTINVPIGQRVNLDLPDGTNVWLNSGATLRYPVDFGRAGQRRVSLEGEGFFKVAHDEARPFVVETFAFNVKALGTEFNVMASKNCALFETSLFEGSVVVDNHSNMRLATLTPNHKMTLMPNGKLMSSVILDYDVYRWKDGLYCFKSKHLDEILIDLERYYDTQVQLESQKYNKSRITGKFRVKDGIYNVMLVLQRELGFAFDYDREKNIVRIR